MNFILHWHAEVSEFLILKAKSKERNEFPVSKYLQKRQMHYHHYHHHHYHYH